MFNLDWKPSKQKKQITASVVVRQLVLEKKWKMTALIGTLLTTAVLNPVEAYAFGTLLDLYTADKLSLNSFLLWGSICLAVPFVIVVATLFQEHLVIGMQDYLQVNLSKHLQERLFQANPLMLETQHGKLDKVVADTSREVSRIALYVPWLVTPVVTIICYLAACVWVNTWLGLLCIIPLLLCVFSTGFWGKIRKLAKNKNTARLEMWGHVRETTDNIRSIQRCQTEATRSLQFGEIGKQFMKRNREMLLPRFYASTMFTSVASIFAKGIILFLGLWIWQLPVGKLYQFWNYMSQSVNSLSQVNTYFTRLMEIFASFKLFTELWNAEPYKVDANAKELNGFHSLCFESVSAGYPRYISEEERFDEAPAMIVHDLSFEIDKGDFVALVGETGCGKSTIAKMIMGELSPFEGSLKLNGEEISRFTPESRWEKIYYCTQFPDIFKATVSENLAYSRSSASPSEIEEAAKRSALFDTIVNKEDCFPDGFESEITAETLSGGEAARVSVARAMLSRAELLIFDEPTAAVDAKTERKMRDGMDQLHVEGRTLLVITHRLSTIQKATKVIVMDKGSVVQMGTYDELIQQEGLFREYCKELSLT